MEKHVCHVKVTFEGIYGWGTGFYSDEKYFQWMSYWRNIKSYSWRFVPAKEDYSCPHLISTSDNIYLHAMGFDVTFVSNGVKVNGSYFQSDIDELAKLCQGAAEACGGTCQFLVSDEEIVNFEFHEYQLAE